MKIEERFNRVLAGLSHTGYTTEIEKCEARIFIEELYKQNQKYKEVIDKLTFIKNRARAGATQETINKLAITFVNAYLKEVE